MSWIDEHQKAFNTFQRAIAAYFDDEHIVIELDHTETREEIRYIVTVVKPTPPSAITEDRDYVRR